ncbi:MAG: response regulator [Cocleimonas sp.]
MDMLVTPPLNIAIVDDDESVLDAVQTVLDVQGWVTHTYTSGEAFLSDLKHHKLDCIILDSNLPGLSGAAVAQAISTGVKNIPIISLTAYPGSSQTAKIKRLVIHEVLVKPVTAEVLIEHIQKAIMPTEEPR